MNSFRSKIGAYAEELPIHLIHYSETVGALKPFLNVSRFFGVPNFSVVDWLVSRGGVWTFLALLSLFILTNQIFLLGSRIAVGEDFVRISGPEIIMRVHVILTLIWSLMYSGKLSDALRGSPYVENRINKVYSGAEGDSLGTWALRRKCILWTVAYIILSIFLTAKTLFLEVFTGTRSFSQIWANYGEQNCGLPSGLMFHASIVAAYCILMDLVTNFLWLFGDFLLLLIALVMAHMFRRINVNGIQKIEPSRLSAIEIDLVREHHGLTAKLVKEFDDAIAPLNLINVVFNTAFIVLAVYSIVTLRRGQRLDSSRVLKLYCKIGVAVFKMLAAFLSASVLHHRAHEELSSIRSLPMAREYNDFSLSNGRASVMQAFVSQLSQHDTGMSVGKVVTITGKLMALLALGVGVFIALARITISSCTRTRGSLTNFGL